MNANFYKRVSNSVRIIDSAYAYIISGGDCGEIAWCNLNRRCFFIFVAKSKQILADLLQFLIDDWLDLRISVKLFHSGGSLKNDGFGFHSTFSNNPANFSIYTRLY